MHKFINILLLRKPYFTNENGEEVTFWKPVQDPFNMNVIDINEKVREVKFPFQERLKFWESLNFSDDYTFPSSLIKEKTEWNRKISPIRPQQVSESSINLLESETTTISDIDTEVTETERTDVKIEP